MGFNLIKDEKQVIKKFKMSGADGSSEDGSTQAEGRERVDKALREISKYSNLGYLFEDKHSNKVRIFWKDDSKNFIKCYVWVRPFKSDKLDKYPNVYLSQDKEETVDEEKVVKQEKKSGYYQLVIHAGRNTKPHLFCILLQDSIPRGSWIFVNDKRKNGSFRHRLFFEDGTFFMKLVGEWYKDIVAKFQELLNKEV